MTQTQSQPPFGNGRELERERRLTRLEQDQVHTRALLDSHVLSLQEHIASQSTMDVALNNRLTSQYQQIAKVQQATGAHSTRIASLDADMKTIRKSLARMDVLWDVMKYGSGGLILGWAVISKWVDGGPF